MTKNFSNQRRDGMPPSSRNSSSGGYREDQSSRPARPRLSRDAVDRAWENGATRTYADYRPRQSSPNTPAQRQGRPAPGYERSRQPQNRRPYSASQESYGTPRQGGYQTRQQSDTRPHYSNQPGYRAPANQSGFNGERWTRPSSQRQTGDRPERFEEQRAPRFQQDTPPSPYRGSNRSPRFQQNTPGAYRGNERPARFQQDAPPYRGSNRSPRFQPNDGPNSYGNTEGAPQFQRENRAPQQARSFDRPERTREQFNRGPRTNQPAPRRDSYNPRWQSRPGPQRDYTSARNDHAEQERPGRAQFEGDYERFNEYEHTNRDEQDQPSAPYTRPVTRTPEGRVLKGSRPSQRKQARFWNGVEGESQTLLSNDPTVSGKEESLTPQPEAAETTKPASRAARPKRPGESRAHKVKTVKTARAEGAKPHTDKVARKNARGPQKPVTRPSQRGYKWPTAGE